MKTRKNTNLTNFTTNRTSGAFFTGNWFIDVGIERVIEVRDYIY